MRPFLISVLLTLASLAEAKGQYSGSRHLWYNTPGSDFKSALPVGNGRLGALVQGSASERIIINENSVWSGPFQDRVNPKSSEGFPDVRKLLTENKFTEAADLAASDMYASPATNRWYSVTGDLLLDFGHDEKQITNYERWLDTLKGDTGYNTSETHPDLFRLTASKKGALDVDVSLYRDRGILSNSASASTKTVLMDVGGSGADAIPFTAGVRAVTKAGTVRTNEGTLQITGASTVDLFLDVETSFQWDSEPKWKAGLASKLGRAAERGFESLKAEATSDHSSLMGRVKLDLGSGGDAASLPTNERIEAFESDPDQDPEFITLSFHFGRHLLISASRDAGGTGLGVPANLQGIWNDKYNPPWGSKYTVNINTEMNYWLAELTDLPETLRPLWDLMYRSRDKGSDVAKKMYNCPGYVSHHNLDLWGDSAPHDSGTAYTIWPSSNLWLSQHLMEHYRFTGDKAFLKDKAWPLFKDIASFFDCYLFKFEGHWTSGPSTSPENVFVIPKDGSHAGDNESLDISITMDNSLLREFFSNVIEAAGVLGISLKDDDVLSKVEAYRDGLRPTQIGARGQIQEWRQDYSEAEPGHRHLSHLIDLFPAKAMSPHLNDTLADAARKTIELRLSASGAATGWSRIWTACLFARLLDGDEAFDNIQTLLRHHPTTNLFNEIEPGQAFQIDSNYGLVAAVAETLVQSHAGVVHLLPALSSKVKSGSVSGLVARGAFVVSISWKEGILEEARIKSRLGGTLKLRVADGSRFKIDGREVDEVETRAGSTYTVTL
ncbi:hypothetical protein ACJZ2D_010292 [Fusarium nematophilum]